MAGRPEKPLSRDIPQPVRRFAALLRELRTESGRTFQELGEKTGVSATTLSRLTSGRSVPKWEVVAAFLDACELRGMEREVVYELWQAADGTARAETRPAELSPWASQTIDAAFQAMEQHAVLRALHTAAGSPSMRVLEERSGVARSAVHRALMGQSTAGMADVTYALLPLVPPGDREQWASQVAMTFGEETAPHDMPPLFRATAGARGEETARAFRAFTESLRQVRNAIAHGKAEADPQFAAQVMALAALVEQRTRPPARADRKDEA